MTQKVVTLTFVSNKDMFIVCHVDGINLQEKQHEWYYQDNGRDNWLEQINLTRRIRAAREAWLEDDPREDKST